MRWPPRNLHFHLPSTTAAAAAQCFLRFKDHLQQPATAATTAAAAAAADDDDAF